MDDNDGPANAILVSDRAGNHAEDGRKDVRRCRQQLSLRGAESHALAKNERKIVAVGEPGHGRRQSEEPPAIQLPVLQVVQHYLDGDGILHCVATVGIDAIHHPSFLVDFQKSVSLVGKVDEDEIARDTNDTGDCSFDDHDPCRQVRY